MLESLMNYIPKDLLTRSGKVVYSGRKAFSAPSNLYVMGENPGGSPETHHFETIGGHANAVLQTYPYDWSAYRDESWKGHAPGTFGMAPRMLHMFKELGLNPGSVPASNLFFVRSARSRDICSEERNYFADQCWAFHANVLAMLQPKAILCLGKIPGNYVRQKIGAHELVREFIETNNRRWRTQVYSNGSGMQVIVATHPSIADWTAIDSDPSHIVLDAIK